MLNEKRRRRQGLQNSEEEGAHVARKPADPTANRDEYFDAYKELSHKLKEKVWSHGSDLNKVIVRLECLKRAVGTETHKLPVVLMFGPSGSGKTTIAEDIHHRLFRDVKGAKFETLQLSELTPTLAEDAIKGHVKGAFTGAITERIGKFEHLGTVLIDDPQATGKEVQAILLGLIESRWCCRIGSNKRQRIKCLIIFATTAPLKILPDLWFRARLRVEMPSVAKICTEKIPDIPANSGLLMILLTAAECLVKGWIDHGHLSNESLLGRHLEAYQTCLETLNDLTYGDTAEAEPTAMVTRFHKVISKEAIEWIKERKWFGNFRELEAIFSELAYSVRRETIFPITRQDLERAAKSCFVSQKEAAKAIKMGFDNGGDSSLGKLDAPLADLGTSDHHAIEPISSLGTLDEHLAVYWKVVQEEYKRRRQKGKSVDCVSVELGELVGRKRDTIKDKCRGVEESLSGKKSKRRGRGEFDKLPNDQT